MVKNADVDRVLCDLFERRDNNIKKSIEKEKEEIEKACCGNTTNFALLENTQSNRNGKRKRNSNSIG